MLFISNVSKGKTAEVAKTYNVRPRVPFFRTLRPIRLMCSVLTCRFMYMLHVFGHVSRTSNWHWDNNFPAHYTWICVSVSGVFVYFKCCSQTEFYIIFGKLKLMIDVQLVMKVCH